MLVYLVAALAAVLNAFVWARYIQRVAERRAIAAGLYDTSLLLFHYGVLQLWAIRSNDPMLLAVWIVFNGFGTFLSTRRKNAQQKNVPIKLLPPEPGSPWYRLQSTSSLDRDYADDGECCKTPPPCG